MDVIPDLYQGLPQLGHTCSMGERSGEKAGQGSVEMFLLCDEVGDNSCDVKACVILLKCDITSMNLQEREDLRTENFITVLQLGSVMCSDASPNTIMLPPPNDDRSTTHAST